MKSLWVVASVVTLVALGLLAPGWADEPKPTPKTDPHLKTHVTEYKDGDVACKGYLAFDPTISSLRPVVLVVHDWLGQGDFAKRTAEMMVEWGYVGFAVDMYGDAKLATDPKEAAGLAGQFRGENRAKGRARAKAALAALEQLPFADRSRVACLGFCFGGTISLELAWSGAPLKAAISFHGSPTAPAEGDSWTADLLVLHGGDDPFVPVKMLTDFQDAVRKQKGEYELVVYSGALHSFTDPSVDARGMDGAKYDRRAAKRAFARCEALLKDAFAR